MHVVGDMAVVDDMARTWLMAWRWWLTWRALFIRPLHPDLYEANKLMILQPTFDYIKQKDEAKAGAYTCSPFGST